MTGSTPAGSAGRALLAHYDSFKYGDTLGVFQYPMFSPFGIDGGYYYVRGILSF
jgi:hypothetical protein